jgi:IS605 OrfB family transposase
MENLNVIRRDFKKSKGLNRRFHSLLFRRLQAIIEYKGSPRRVRSQILD